jgi:hypothetical protein
MPVDSALCAHAVPPEPWRSFRQDFDTQLKGAKVGNGGVREVVGFPVGFRAAIWAGKNLCAIGFEDM